MRPALLRPAEAIDPLVCGSPVKSRRWHRRIALLITLEGLVAPAISTELTSSQSGYVLTPEGNPYSVAPGATIDTTANNGLPISGSGSGETAWSLTNNGTLLGTIYAISLDARSTVVNNGNIASRTSIAVAMFGGGSLFNASGASISGAAYGVFIGPPDSTLVNAGSIGDEKLNGRPAQAGVMMREGSVIQNQATGRIVGVQYGIVVNSSATLVSSAATIENAGLIQAYDGTAIDLSALSLRSGSVVTNSGSIISDTGTAILFGPAADVLRLTGTSRILGTVDAGRPETPDGDTLVLTGSGPGTFDISGIGPQAQYRGFEILRKEDSGVWTLSGANTDAQSWQIAGGTLVVAGQLAGNVMAVPGATGVEIQVTPGGAVAASAGPALAVGDASHIINQGTVTSTSDSAPAIAGSGSGTTVTNRGTLIGNPLAVQFSGSNDTLILDTGSSISGDLDGGNGAGNGLVLQGSGDLANHAYGFATLAMRGTDWTLTGNIETTSAATVETGLLRLNGALNSPALTIAPAATLAGTGTIQAATSVQGTIAPGDSRLQTDPRTLTPGTLGFSGAYTQLPGSRYEFEANRAGSDLIDVSGAASLQGGDVQVRVRATSAEGTTTYRILTASAGVTGTFASAVALSPFVAPILSYDSNNAYLSIRLDFELARGTPNQIAIEQGLTHGLGGIRSGAPPSRDFGAVAVDLINQEGAAAFAALDQLSAESYTSLPNAHFAALQLSTEAINARLADARHAVACTAQQIRDPGGSGEYGDKPYDDKHTSAVDSSPGAPGQICSWITALGSTSKVGGYDSWLSQDIGLFGFIGGVDYRIANDWTIGGAVGYMHGDTSTDTLPTDGRFDSFQTLLYASFTHGAYWAQGMIGFALNDDRMNRSISFTDPAREAQGTTNGTQYAAVLRTGFDFPLGKYGIASPFVALDAQRLGLSGFTETGADAVNLVVAGTSASAVRSVLGAQWRNAVDWLRRTWNLDSSLAWVHRYGALTRAVEARFVGAPNSNFILYGAGPDRDAAQIQLGASVALGRQSHAFIRYNGEFGGNGHTHAGNIGVDYKW